MRWIAAPLACAALGACTAPPDSARSDAPRVEAAWGARHSAETTELVWNGRLVLRTVHDFARDRQLETFKVYTHLFGPAGEGPLTKGDPGGLYPHHRGVFVGWNRVLFRGRRYDFWHGKDGVAQVLGEREAAAGSARQVFALRWLLADGTPVLKERRTLSAVRGARGELVLDVASELSSDEPVELSGDPHHAGCHVRLGQEVAEHEKDTVVLLPSGARPVKGNDDSVQAACPFAAVVATIAGRRWVTAHFDHPGNPGDSQCSVRRYGRIGAFTTARLAPGRSLLLRWRVVLADAAVCPELATEEGLRALSPSE